MKKTLRLMVVVLAIAMLSACFASTTLSKYKTEVGTGSETVKVAKWGFKPTTVTLNLFSSSIYNEEGKHVGSSASNIIAPGAIGSTSIKLATVDNAPEVDYTISLTGTLTVPNALDEVLQFKAGNGSWTDADDFSISYSKDYYAGTNPSEFDYTIWWRWNPESQDTADTTLGNADTLSEATVEITIVAEQNAVTIGDDY